MDAAARRKTELRFTVERWITVNFVRRRYIEVIVETDVGDVVGH